MLRSDAIHAPIHALAEELSAPEFDLAPVVRMGLVPVLRSTVSVGFAFWNGMARALQASTSRITLPWTSVRRKSRPL